MNHAFDTKALELSRQAIALFFEPMPGVQLQAKIQNLFIAAMEFAAPEVQEGQPVSQPYTLREWIPCSERLPDIGTEIFYFCQDDGLRDCGIVSSSNFSGRGDAELYVHAEGYDLRFGVDITHWMPLPAAPQQEANNG